MNPDNTTKAGTVGGTLFTVFYNIKSEDIVKTIVLASIGAVVSFLVSLMLKRIFKQNKK
jgi:hypothetical protein